VFVEEADEGWLVEVSAFCKESLVAGVTHSGAKLIGEPVGEQFVEHGCRR
jgi:hypothetical protein